MTIFSSFPAPSPRAVEEFHIKALSIKPVVSASRLWERYLSSEDRERLGDDFEAAYYQHGTAGMWAKLHGVTPLTAIIEVAKILGFLRDEDHDWLLREIGEKLDPEEALAHAIACGDLVLLEQPRQAHWDGEMIDIDWERQHVLWVFLWQLGRHAKAGQPIDRFSIGENAHEDVVTKQKSRLINLPEFPDDLGGLIESVGLRTQKLKLSPERIRIFELSGIDTLCEWNP